jgi:hypothetical protein
MERHKDIQAKLQKLEELFARGATEGERAAAGAALDRFAARLDHVSQEAETEIRYSLPDTWAVRIFVALCRKHGVRPYRYPRQRAYHSYGPILLKNSDFQKNLKLFAHTAQLKNFGEGFGQNGLSATAHRSGTPRGNPLEVLEKMCFWREIPKSQLGSFSTE